MSFCRNCGSTLPCTCACSNQTVRIIHDDVDERKVESLMKDTLKAENKGNLNYAEKCYNEIIEEIDGNRDYSSMENETKRPSKTCIMKDIPTKTSGNTKKSLKI